MGKLFCLMGKSSSGKDTLYRLLMEDKSQELHTVVPYTTRPIRSGEENGREYFFTDEEGMKKLEEEGKIIESRCYHTYHGDWYYFTVDDGQIELSTKDYLIIGTLESYNRTREYFGNESVVPIYIELDDGERLQRALNREKMQKEPKYEEMCRRFLADSADFSPENLEKSGIIKRFENVVLEDCLLEIKDYISKAR